APRALANQAADAGAAEVPRHRVAARTCKFVDQHHLRSEDRTLRLHFVAAITRSDAREQLPRQELDDVGGERAAAVETFVDDHRLLVDLRKEVAGEVREATE